MVAKSNPTPESYQKDIPNLLLKLGFSPERAQYVAQDIVVDPARGSGHAMGAEMRSEKAHLRTRVEKTGMNYKGFNIAVHEMGHNVEQTFSLNDVDHTQATPSQLNAATLQIAKDVWNRYYAPVFHQRDVVLLAVYSHMIDSFLYLPDYSIGHLIAAQIEEQTKKAGAIGPEFERMAKMGDVTPGLWMENASGKPV